VAYVSKVRWDQANPDGDLAGAPDLVIEVVSPSNTVAELYEREQLCLANGSREFWVVDPDRRQIRVATPDGTTKTYGSGREIPLLLFGEARLSVDSVFA
jgi:Uma2 family endonuclease